MVKIIKASENLYNICLLLNGVIRTYPIQLDKGSLVCPVAEIEQAFRELTGHKDARVMSLTKVKEIINVEL